MRAVRHTPEGICPVEVPQPTRVAVVGPGITGFGLLGGAAARWRGFVVDMEPDHDLHAAAAERMGLGGGAGRAFALAASDTPTLKVVVEP